LFEAAGSGHTILTPNTELAAALFDAVERMHIDRQHDVWPTPQIRDFNGWLRERHVIRQLADASLPRLLSDVEERELWRTVILDSDAGKELLEPAGAAHAARRARRAMAEYGIPSTALDGHATDEVLALRGWLQRFDERCAMLNCIGADRLLDAASLAATAGAAASGAATRGLIWIDSPSWRPVARGWLGRHAVAMLHADEHPRDAAIHRYRAASPGAEIAAIAEWALEQLRSAPASRIWVCIPDLQLRRVQVEDAFDAVLAPRRFGLSGQNTPAPYAIAGGTPLADFAPVSAALALLSATTGPVGFETFSAILRLAELQPSDTDAAAAARLDTALRSRATDSGTLHEWLLLAERVAAELFAGQPTAVRRVRAFQRVLGKVQDRHPLSRWVAVWVDAFEAAPWAERTRWSSDEFQAAERFRELLAALAVADEIFGHRSAASAARIARRAARDTAFQPQTGIPPVWVSGQVMDPWLPYEGLWVTGCNEERWPPPPDPVPLLPVTLQRDFGIVSAGVESQLRLATDLQCRWQARARASVFSAADAEDGRAATLSPLLPSAPEPPLPPPVMQPHWQRQAHCAPLLETLDDEQAPPFATPEVTRGVSTLRCQSQCPFRGFAMTRLQTPTLDRPIPGFNARERGQMLHDALEHIWSDMRSLSGLQSTPPESLDRLLRLSVSAAIAGQCARRDPGERWRRREHPRLEELLRRWLATESQREPFEVERLEQDSDIARHAGLEFSVRIDRVDRLADGGRVLIDYKTGMAPPDWRGERPDNPQLPIYALLRPDALVAVAYGRVNASDCSFVAETDRAGLFKPRGKPSQLEGHPTFGALLATWARRIERIAGEFRDGDARVAPTLRACASCHLQPLCRVPSAYAAEGDHDE
jgi:ATP-dependent helicase/nuclease subunit B